jgi:protein-S-isoprenylcysteine O-methyltransferase Ste14
MKNQLKKNTVYKIGVSAQIAIIASLVTLEILWGAIAQQDLLRGLYCLFFFAIFAFVMFDLYILNSRNNKLKTTGAFRFSRHPVYVCLFMISLSYWFANTESLIPIIILQVILWTGLVIASLVQEKVILDKYGKSAENYYTKTPRFLFF